MPDLYLKIYLNHEHVGNLFDTTPLSLEYTHTWLNREHAFSIATLPLLATRQTTVGVEAFFENLLPEGELRDYIASRRQVSSLFSLLRETAGDTAGAFTLLPEGTLPQAPSYIATSWQALADVLRKKTAAAIDLNGQETRISLAGAQDKASIAIFADGIPRLPQGIAPSTHILKPNIKRLNKVWDTAANEALVMRLADYCGLPTADVFYESTTQSCVVKRFDRVTHSQHVIDRLIQYDFCQLSGVLSDKKYEKEGGPGIEQCAALIRTYSSQPAIDLRHFAQWILFNLYVGNNDCHAKNLSFYLLPGKGMVLTPFYDLMCTRLYPGLAMHFAMSVGGETIPGKISQDNIALLAKHLGMHPKFIKKLATDLAANVVNGLEKAKNDLYVQFPRSAQIMSERLAQFILSTTRKTAERITED